MDVFNPDTWKQQWAALMSAPYIIVPLLAIVAGAVWWFRGKIFEATVSGLREQINACEARLQLAAEKLALELGHQDTLARQFNDLKEAVKTTAGNGALAARIAKVEATIDELAAASNAVRSAIGTVTGIGDSLWNTPLPLRVEAEAAKASKERLK
jgi:hypothetical protein